VKEKFLQAREVYYGEARDGKVIKSSPSKGPNKYRKHATRQSNNNRPSQMQPKKR